jgi:hypothetical protein
MTARSAMMLTLKVLRVKCKRRMKSRELFSLREERRGAPYEFVLKKNSILQVRYHHLT